MRVAGCGLRVAGSGLRVAGSGLRVAGCGLRVAGCGLTHKIYSTCPSTSPPHAVLVFPESVYISCTFWVFKTHAPGAYGHVHVPISEGTCKNVIRAHAFRKRHVYVPTCTWGMCLKNPKCAGDIYGDRKKKRVQFHCFVLELLADEVGVQFTSKFDQKVGRDFTFSKMSDFSKTVITI